MVTGSILCKLIYFFLLMCFVKCSHDDLLDGDLFKLVHAEKYDSILLFVLCVILTNFRLSLQQLFVTAYVAVVFVCMSKVLLRRCTFHVIIDGREMISGSGRM